MVGTQPAMSSHGRYTARPCHLMVGTQPSHAISWYVRCQARAQHKTAIPPAINVSKFKIIFCLPVYGLIELNEMITFVPCNLAALIFRPVSEFLMLRDSTLIPNVLWFEYTSQRGEARSRQRKSISRKSQ